jgi:hypothetical protein
MAHAKSCEQTERKIATEAYEEVGTRVSSGCMSR